MSQPMSRMQPSRAGLREVRLWVPDTRSSAFVEECRRQSGLIRESENEVTRAEDQAWEVASWEALGDDQG